MHAISVPAAPPFSFPSIFGGLLVFWLNLLPILNWLGWGDPGFGSGLFGDWAWPSSNMHKHLFKD